MGRVRQCRIGIPRRIEFDHTGAQPEGSANLLLGGIDEQAHIDIVGLQTFYRIGDGLLIPRAVQPAGRRDLSRKFRNQRYLIGYDVQRKSRSFPPSPPSRCSASSLRFPEDLHVAMLNVPPVAAQMHGNAVRAGQFANRGCRDRIGFIGAPGLTDGRDVIDIY